MVVAYKTQTRDDATLPGVSLSPLRAIAAAALTLPGQSPCTHSMSKMSGGLRW